MDEMKSALRDLRHIQAIPTLAESHRGWNDPRNEDEAKNERIARARMDRTRVGYLEALTTLTRDLVPYLLGRQHDAFIVGHRREGDRFTLTALDEDLSMLVEWKYGRDRRVHGIPFEIVFEGVSYVGWRIEEADGSLRPAPELRDFTHTYWSNDALIDPELPGIRWAMRMFHQRYERGHFVGRDELVVLVEAERIRVIEPRREDWIQRFGESEAEIFDRYAAMRLEVSLSHQPESLAAFGITLPRITF